MGTRQLSGLAAVFLAGALLPSGAGAQAWPSDELPQLRAQIDKVRSDLAGANALIAEARDKQSAEALANAREARARLESALAALEARRAALGKVKSPRAVAAAGRSEGTGTVCVKDRCAPLSAKTVLEPGARVQTGPGARLTLHLKGGGHVVLKESSDFILDPEENVYGFLKGTVHALFLPQGRRTGPARFYTPTAVAGVRGTEFDLFIEDGRTWLRPYAGTVELAASTSAAAGSATWGDCSARESRTDKDGAVYALWEGACRSRGERVLTRYALASGGGFDLRLRQDGIAELSALQGTVVVRAEGVRLPAGFSRWWE